MEAFHPTISSRIKKIDFDIQTLITSVQDLVHILPKDESSKIVNSQLDNIVQDYKDLKRNNLDKRQSIEEKEFFYRRIRSLYLSLKIVHENIQKKYSVHFSQPLASISSYLDYRETASEISLNSEDLLLEEILELLHDGDQEEVIKQITLLESPEILDQLLNKSSQLDESLLMLSSEWGDNELVEYLINHPFMTYEGINLENQEGESAFTLACKEENLETLSLLLSTGSLNLRRLNFQSDKDRPFLHELVERSCFKSLAFLLQKDAFNFDAVNQERESLLFLACKREDEELIDLLLSHHSKMDINQCNLLGETPLHYACKKGLDQIVLKLLACPSTNLNALDKKRQTPLFLACQYAREGVIELMLENDSVIIEKDNIQGVSPLKMAVWKDVAESFVKNKPELEEKMNKEIEQSEQFFSPREELCWLVKRNTHLKIFQDIYLENYRELDKLLRQPLDANILNAVDSFGNSVLSYLVMYEKVELISMMMNHKNFMPNLLKVGNCDGKNPFYLACETGNKEVIDNLIFSGMLDKECVNQLSKSGETPLTMLCKKRDEEAIEAILQFPELDTTQANELGETPESLAKFQLLTNLIAYFNTKEQF
ncbi:MAG: ankyrin repeat domain-containing protein [Chlamydiales bacterium]|nr:ankyrin repeat domain-containing protein [Chlamydiales bacterium]